MLVDSVKKNQEYAGEDEERTKLEHQAGEEDLNRYVRQYGGQKEPRQH